MRGRASLPRLDANGRALVGLMAVAASGCFAYFAPPTSPEERAFSWPPPVASARVELPEALSGRPTLGEAARRLAGALDAAGYRERSFYDAPNGFALVTRLEQIDSDGRPKLGKQRWSPAHPEREIFSISSYLQAVFVSNPGYYRLLVFVVTDAGFTPGQRPGSWEWLKGWSERGDLVLPAARASLPTRDAHRCAALIYEFERPHADADPRLLQPSPLTGQEHLAATGMWRSLGGEL